MIIKAKDWKRPRLSEDQNIQQAVKDMLNNIQQNGDSAIENYSQQFDQFKPEVIELKSFDDYPLEPELKLSIRAAAKRIKRFSRFQKEDLGSKTFSDEFGEYGQVVAPIECAGCYIPGGRFPLISTALMTLIPAKVAGCKERIAVSPSTHPALLAAASLAGATQFIRIGGVQAIGALVYGYQSLKPVDVIVGPGNAYVNEAKAQVQRRVKIDGLAGPSELLALCDDQQPIEWLAYDALAQSEHDPMALSVLVSDSQDWLRQVELFLSNNSEFRKLLDNQQVALILCDSVVEMVDFCNDFAPEHLMLCDKRITNEQLKHYGSLFIGANSAVALGDYCSGPNHTLPTLGYARQSGGLNVSTFLRVQTVQKVSDLGRSELASIAMPLAKAEGLDFHFESLAVRAKGPSFPV